MNTSAARHPDLLEQLLEQLPGATDERHALFVLAGPGRLSDEHQIGVRVAGPEHDRPARRRELRAAHAAPSLREQELERLTPLGRRLQRLPKGHAPGW